MPKDPTRNQPNYKIGGSHLNEFEYARNQGAMTEAEHERFLQQQGERQAGEEGRPAPQTEAERIQQLMTDVHEQVERRKARAQGGAAKKGAKKKAGARATKRTGAKAAKKTGTQLARGAGRKATATAKKAGGATKKSGARGATKSGGARKGATKSVRSNAAAKGARGAVTKRAAGRGPARSAGRTTGAGKKGARKSAR